MSDFSIKGDTITATKDFLDSVIKTASAEGAKTYKTELLKDTVVSTREAAEYLNCSVPKVIEYMNAGHKEAGILPAISTGRNYRINKYDLQLFKEAMQIKV